MARAFERIQAAAVDGRAHNIFYRQRELEHLCNSLLEHADAIRQAITTDYGSSEAESASEYYLTISAVKRNYASLQPAKAHEEEYLVANGKNAPDQLAPFGVMYIEPTTHTLFYSAIVPLAAAITAGNCVILLLENNLRATSGLLRRILPSALEKETFAIASSPVNDSDLLSKALHVNQNGGSDWPRANQLISAASSRTVAVVDRTGDVQLAARELVASRFAYGGKSPYAPDIVLINEFAKKDFLQAVVSECVSLGSGVALNGTLEKGAKSSNVKDSLEHLKTVDSELRVVLQESKFAVVDLPSRLQSLPTSKVEAPILVVSSMRSLDDAIDLITRSTDSVYLAAYYFSNPVSGKYLSQFIDASVSFINHAPRQLLVGPAFPTAHPINPDERYPVSLFCQSRPAYSICTPETAELSAALSSASNAAAQKLWTNATAPLAVMKRHEGGGTGFFEQGFLISASLVLTSVVSVSGASAWLMWRSSRRV